MRGGYECTWRRAPAVAGTIVDHDHVADANGYFTINAQQQGRLVGRRPALHATHFPQRTPKGRQPAMACTVAAGTRYSAVAVVSAAGVECSNTLVRGRRNPL
ncbi:hypothetical protein CCHOA_01750 [Corynebacterium choanae]|uniref:Uncharacterized protein n=1 Tax=Corynebacterium choanae TaxID=1862358 RepID=A0A3G6J784_9CORY|nr:hypothetical protein CCHOA_01750 [Corynebacterium choanae]